MSIATEISVGEFLDKLSILRIKSTRISDTSKLDNIQDELKVLEAIWRACAYASMDLSGEMRELTDVNEILWDIEDRIRALEARRDFGADFIDLARSVYITNDRRAAIKRRINEKAGSSLVEEKSYVDYTAPPSA